MFIGTPLLIKGGEQKNQIDFSLRVSLNSLFEPAASGELEFLPALWKDLGNFSVAGDFSLVTFFSSVKRK